jgi:phytol kinase
VTFGLVAALFIGLCVGVEVLARRVGFLSPELVRKLAHMVSAALAALLPFVLSFGQIALLGVLFAGVMAVSQRSGIFTAIHGVSRRTYGEVLFPLGIAALALLCPSPLSFGYGVLVLGLGDGLAAVIGERFGRRTVPLLQTRKTLWGTGAFLAVCFALGLVLLAPTSISPAYLVAAAAAMAIALTPIELFLTYGLDNLALPPVAGLLLTVWL